MKSDYRYEMHLHTKEFGWCAQVWAKDIVDIYVNEGYDGICVTNHFFSEGMETMQGDTWEEKVDSWLSGYNEATKQAWQYPGFDVILGAELRIEEGYEDLLLYGITRDLLVATPQIFSFTIQELYDFANKNGVLVFQAHPLRPGLNLKDFKCLHGLEVFNGNARHTNQNERVLQIAKHYNLLLIGGSDYHQIGDEASVAMLFPYRVSDSIEMAESLRRSQGRIEILR